MIIHPPFMISARLAPGLRLGDATLSLIKVERGDERRTRATFALDIPDHDEYIDSSLQSGNGGFSSLVAAFATMLTFMSACGEGVLYEERTGRESENSSIFPRHIAAWCAEHLNVISQANDELGNEYGELFHNLIEEES